MDSKEKRRSLKLAEHYFRNNNYSFAQHILDKVIKVDSKDSKANELLAYIHGNLGHVDIAFELLNIACKQNDCSPEALYYLGSAYLKRNLFSNAIDSFKKSILQGGEFFEALHDLATAQVHIGDITSAVINYQKCLNYGRPSHELFYNIARIYDDLKHFDKSITHYDQALSLKPDFAEAHFNKGLTLNELKRYNEAIAHFDKAFGLKPDIDWLYGDLIHTKMKICSWSVLGESLKVVSKKVIANEKVINPFQLLALNDDPLLHQQAAKLYGQARFPLNRSLGPIFRRTIGQKIRIGYFSADFKNHPVSFLTAELFELHDKNRFQIIAFSFGIDDQSPMRSRLSRAFDQFIDVHKNSDKEIAQLARDIEIDIAVDLSGYTKDSRTGIFSYQAAPVQVSYLGYLGTMGVEYIDYILADKTLIPDGSATFYSEKIVYLPSYQVNDRKRVISNKIFSKRELGLPENSFIFCCFNNNYKILPSIFDLWMRILIAVDNSILYLYAENQWAEVNFKKEAEARGVDSKRIIFGKHLPADEYLSRYRICDLFLDTTPYNAGTTASDALWTGLPVLTLMGQSFASRMAASLLNAIGLPELITNTQEEYEVLAIELATNSKRLEEIKLKLANNRLSAPLFDTPLFIKNLESAYIKMYERIA
jgi:protein O-GlcNAc transferase